MRTAMPSISHRRSHVGPDTAYRYPANITMKPPSTVGAMLLDQELTEQLAAVRLPDTQVAMTWVRAPGKQGAECSATRPSQTAVLRSSLWPWTVPKLGGSSVSSWSTRCAVCCYYFWTGGVFFILRPTFPLNVANLANALLMGGTSGVHWLLRSAARLTCTCIVFRFRSCHLMWLKCVMCTLSRLKVVEGPGFAKSKKAVVRE